MSEREIEMTGICILGEMSTLQNFISTTFLNFHAKEKWGGSKNKKDNVYSRINIMTVMDGLLFLVSSFNLHSLLFYFDYYFLLFFFFVYFFYSHFNLYFCFYSFCLLFHHLFLLIVAFSPTSLPLFFFFWVHLLFSLCNLLHIFFLFFPSLLFHPLLFFITFAISELISVFWCCRC